MSWYGNTYYDDDGSTLTYDGGAWSATPAEAANIVQSSTATDDTGFLSVLNQFSNLATHAGNTIATLQAQRDAIGGMQAARDLARYKQDAALSIGKTSADIAVINAQRDVALAKAAAGGVKSIASGEALMLAALIAGLVLVLKR